MGENGIKIQFWLKHGLNSPAHQMPIPGASEPKTNNIIALTSKRRTNPSPAVAGSEECNLGIGKLQDLVNGSERRT